MMTTTVVSDALELASLRSEWQGLLARSATPEPMLTPAWMLTWWDVFGPHEGRALRVGVVREGGRLVGLMPLLARATRHWSGVPLQRLELLGSGEQECEEICSEYIGVIAEQGAEDGVARALADALARGAFGPWDEVLMPAMRGDAAMPVLLAAALRERDIPASVEVTSSSPYVPLPASWEAYLAALPSSRRQYVRKSLREFESWAGSDLRFHRVESPADLPHAQRVLMSLHATRWTAGGQSGVFAADRFRAFHGSVMGALLETGALDLGWISVRGEPVAASYNFVHDGRVRFYQSGRRVDLPKNVRAGIVLHAYAIKRAIESGMREYDFLAGTQRYKLDLALATRPLVRLRAARPSAREALRGVAEVGRDHARAVRDAVRGWWRARAMVQGSVRT